MARILVIDDEESIRFTFETFLTAEGHEVSTAANYGEAIEVLDRELCDLIFVDVILGAISGIEVLKYVREKGLLAPVVIITGEPSVESAAEVVRLGAFDYVSKPIYKDKLLYMTRNCLKHKSLEDEKRTLETEKKQLRLNLEAIFRSVPDAMITVAPNMNVLQANRATEKLLDTPLSQMQGRALDRFLGPYKEIFSHVLSEPLRSGNQVREYRVECKGRDGKLQTMVLNSAQLLDSEGNSMGAVLLARDISHQAGLERELKERRHFRRIVGKSRRMQDLYQLIEDLSETDTTVLITGASGTGKELVAESLHNGGARSSQSMVKVNCSALSESLLESELFGHVRGAFTGAIRDKVGRFQLADRGTIFLDEIGDISPAIQLKLLRVLQEKEFERVGDSSTVKVDVRVIAATNQNLLEKVRQGGFREDLYYRLKVVELALPALKDRREDIPLLAEHFIEFFNRQFNKRIAGLDEEARALIMGHSWPGNVRELKHSLEHAFILCRGQHIETAHLPREISLGTSSPHERAIAVPPDGIGPDEVNKALVTAGGNKAKAARLLGVSRQTIYRKIKEFNL